MTRTIVRTVFVILGGVIVSAPAAARADWTLSATETGGPTYTNSGTFTSGAGFVISNLTIGDFLISMTLKDTQNANQSQLYLQSLSVQNDANASHTLTITLTDSHYTLPGASGTQMSVDSQLSATAVTTGGTISFQSFVNGNPVTGSPQSVGSPGGFSDAGSSFTRGASYAMQNQTTISLGASGGAQETGATTATAVPEPTTMALSLGGLVSLGVMPWLKRRRKS